MPTRTTDNPFTPRGALSREQVERYLKGELSSAERHQVELHLEQDALLRDAVDGLGMPGALKGSTGLDAYRPSNPRFGVRTWLLIGISLIAVVVAIWSSSHEDPSPAVRPEVPLADVTPVPITPVQHAAFKAELDQATALPESLRSAFRGSDRFVQPLDTAAPVIREDPPGRVDALPPTPVAAPPLKDDGPRTVPEPPSSRKLMFFYDLKLVHPSELYPIDPVLELANGSVDARYADAQARSDARPTDRNVPYDRFFRTAMGKFARGDRQGCLEDLFVVLEEYPEDVNALFYAGLCSYDLGLFPRASELLDRARKHKVDTFIEEAEWYHALAVERARGSADALPLFNSVVERGGFYAARAREHLAAGR